MDFTTAKCIRWTQTTFISFQVAAYWPFKEAFAKAKPCLLEPIHEIEVRIPEDCVGKVMGDLSSRRGNILGAGAHALTDRSSLRIADSNAADAV